MPPDEHNRRYNLLLLNNLLSQTSNSPFTVILDSLEQKSGVLVDEFLQRAKDARIRTVLIAFETIQKPDNVDTIVNAWEVTVATWQNQIATEIAGRTLLIIDSLNAASDAIGSQLPALLSSLLSPQVSLVAVYHKDVPSIVPTVPPTLALMSYLATTLMTVHSLQHILLKKAARDRSVVEPDFGLAEGLEGVVQGLGSNSFKEVVIELEHRRKSGRGIKEWFVLQRSSDVPRPVNNAAKNHICLLEDYPGYRSDNIERSTNSTGEALSTFELGLTERQRQDRDGVVLPYFDAQKGNDEGGRILYDMGSEDDFDEEEDEI